ncbi:hypothetical protein ABZV80_43220 [Streptomyces sp. NPDC005132]|uniref:hypothetical protein n=1 Tax=Streptomyces sp. NPDC005132 TaxID=3154294 RepID=UPI0033B451A5
MAQRQSGGPQISQCAAQGTLTVEQVDAATAAELSRTLAGHHTQSAVQRSLQDVPD